MNTYPRTDGAKAVSNHAKSRPSSKSNSSLVVNTGFSKEEYKLNTDNGNDIPDCKLFKAGLSLLSGVPGERTKSQSNISIPNKMSPYSKPLVPDSIERLNLTAEVGKSRKSLSLRKSSNSNMAQKKSPSGINCILNDDTTKVVFRCNHAENLRSDFKKLVESMQRQKENTSLPQNATDNNEHVPIDNGNYSIPNYGVANSGAYRKDEEMSDHVPETRDHDPNYSQLTKVESVTGVSEHHNFQEHLKTGGDSTNTPYNNLSINVTLALSQPQNHNIGIASNIFHPIEITANTSDRASGLKMQQGSSSRTGESLIPSPRVNSSIQTDLSITTFDEEVIQPRRTESKESTTTELMMNEIGEDSQSGYPSAVPSSQSWARRQPTPKELDSDSLTISPNWSKLGSNVMLYAGKSVRCLMDVTDYALNNFIIPEEIVDCVSEEDLNKAEDKVVVSLMRILGVPKRLRYGIYQEALMHVDAIGDLSITSVSLINNVIDWITGGDCGGKEEILSKLREILAVQTDSDPESLVWFQFEKDFSNFSEAVGDAMKDGLESGFEVVRKLSETGFKVVKKYSQTVLNFMNDDDETNSNSEVYCGYSGLVVNSDKSIKSPNIQRSHSVPPRRMKDEHELTLRRRASTPKFISEQDPFGIERRWPQSENFDDTIREDFGYRASNNTKIGYQVTDRESFQSLDEVESDFNDEDDARVSHSESQPQNGRDLAKFLDKTSALAPTWSGSVHESDFHKLRDELKRENYSDTSNSATLSGSYAHRKIDAFLEARDNESSLSAILSSACGSIVSKVRNTANYLPLIRTTDRVPILGENPSNSYGQDIPAQPMKTELIGFGSGKSGYDADDEEYTHEVDLETPSTEEITYNLRTAYAESLDLEQTEHTTDNPNHISEISEFTDKDPIDFCHNESLELELPRKTQTGTPSAASNENIIIISENELENSICHENIQTRNDEEPTIHSKVPKNLIRQSTKRTPLKVVDIKLKKQKHQVSVCPTPKIPLSHPVTSSTGIPTTTNRSSVGSLASIGKSNLASQPSYTKAKSPRFSSRTEPVKVTYRELQNKLTPSKAPRTNRTPAKLEYVPTNDASLCPAKLEIVSNSKDQNVFNNGNIARSQSFSTAKSTETPGDNMEILRRLSGIMPFPAPKF